MKNPALVEALRYHILQFSWSQIVVGHAVLLISLDARSTTAFIQDPLKLTAAQRCHNGKHDNGEAHEYNETNFKREDLPIF